jgi:hypothetical protein
MREGRSLVSFRVLFRFDVPKVCKNILKTEDAQLDRNA